MGVRAELKEINTWPTFPQLIIRGEFVGGLDVVSESKLGTCGGRSRPG